MKKLICLILIISSCLIGCSTGNGEITMNNSVTSETDSNSSKNEQVLKTEQVTQKSSLKSYRKLIKKKYSEKDILNEIYYRGSDNLNTMIYRLDAKFPMECVRSFDESLPYCIYSLKEGGLMYVFFHDYGHELKFADYVFIVKDVLSQSDFSNLKKGDLLSSVELIDDGMKRINAIKPDYLIYDKTSMHVVEGGFMVIKYIPDTTMSKSIYDYKDYKIDSIEFVPNGEGVVVKDFWDHEHEFKYEILEQDYPK